MPSLFLSNLYFSSPFQIHFKVVSKNQIIITIMYYTFFLLSQFYFNHETIYHSYISCMNSSKVCHFQIIVTGNPLKIANNFILEINESFTTVNINAQKKLRNMIGLLSLLGNAIKHEINPS